MRNRRRTRSGFSLRGEADPCRWPLLGLGAILAVVVWGLSGTAATAGQAPLPPPQRGSLAGQLLVATGEMKDPRFVRTVLYMVRDDTNGAMGLIVNRPIGDASLASLLEGLGMEGKGVQGEIRLHYGGPVESRRGFVLHTTDYATESTWVVNDGIAITIGPDILRAIGEGTGPRRSLVAIGYAGWAPGQLEAEIAAGAWVVVPADDALVFDESHDKKWGRAMARHMMYL